MDFNSLVLGLVTFFLLPLFWFFKRRSASPGRSAPPPRAAGSRPFMGHLHIMGDSDGELPHVKLGALADHHGPIFSINLGLRRAVVVSSFEVAKELFTVHDLKISSRPGSRAMEILSHEYAMFGFAPYGQFWRKMRKLVIIELLSNRRIEMTRSVRESETDSAIKELYNISYNGAPVSLKKWCEDLLFNMFLMVVARKKFNADEKLQLIEAMKDFSRYLKMFVPADAWPVLRWLDFGGHEKRMKETAKQLETIVGRWLKEAEKRRKECSGEDTTQSFMDVLLSVLPAAELESDRDADTIISATCESMILGGVDSSAFTLKAAVSLLLDNPSKLRAAQQELDDKIGRHRQVTESDLNDLVYIPAIVKETFRLHPNAPLGPPRVFTDDCDVGGFHIRKGTWLILNVWKLQRDARVWIDESEFTPERFLNENKNLDVKGQDFELVPFGAGRRMCPGVNLGLQMVHMSLASLLHAFEITKAVDGDHKLVTMPINVVLKPRLDRTVYM